MHCIAGDVDVLDGVTSADFQEFDAITSSKPLELKDVKSIVSATVKVKALHSMNACT